MQGTLESIKDILLNGRINDSYALLRKYYDAAIINIYSNLYLNDHFSINNFIVETINNWLQGKKQLPACKEMLEYIQSSDKLSRINDLFRKNMKYKEVRDRCNDHVHYNFYYNLLLNDNEIFLKNRLVALDSFSEDLKNIFIWHLSYLFYLNDHYMMSSDYIDSLECGLTPEAGSQYYVAPFVQGVFESVIKKNRMDIVTEIIKKTTMKLK
jgi:hypothetical protein